MPTRSTSGDIHTLTPTGSRLRKFPRGVAMALIVAAVVGIPAGPGGEPWSNLLWVIALTVGTLCGCAIATWAELRVYRGLVGVGSAKRVALTLFTPMVFCVIWPLLLIAGGFAILLDDGVLFGATFFGGAWFLSASMGTIVIVLLDVVISALIPDFRSRIQAAVLALLIVSVGFTFAVYQLGLKAGQQIRKAAQDGMIPEDVTLGLTSDQQVRGKEAIALLATAETEQFVALGFLLLAATLGLPAIVSACGKIADAVMERLNPLSEAMERVGEGDLAVRVEVGGSRDLVQITEGFNSMTASLTKTLRDLDVRNRELTDTNAATRRFVPFQFLNLLDKKTIREIARGDQAQLDMSILFCDIRGFTTMAERMGPHATFAFINRYLAHMEAEVHRENGFINDFLGDGIMALFHTGADAAVRAAIGMLEAVSRFNATLRDEGLEPIRIGIGLNSGPIMLGTIGGKDRLSCTVIGDPVNMAARVEGMTKLYGACLLIAEGTRNRLDDPSRYLIREVDRVQAVGKTEAASIYEVLNGLEPSEREDKLMHRERFAEALLAYRKGDFESARDHFERCHDEAPLDGAAALYVERCQRTLRRGPPTNWDGVTRLQSK